MPKGKGRRINSSKEGYEQLAAEILADYVKNFGIEGVKNSNNELIKAIARYFQVDWDILTKLKHIS